MTAYDYPILGFFWSTLILFLWIMWFFLLFRILADIFRSHDLGGFAKTLWIIFVIILPFLGVFVYLIARGNEMRSHAIEDAQSQKAQFDEYVRSTVSSSSTTDELAKLAALRDQGVLTDAEFAAQKARLLG
jgi:ABC-type multidrug transport system fused ATPase/permease subunit